MKKKLMAIAAVSFVAFAFLLSSCNNDGAKNGSVATFNIDSVKAAIASSNAVYGECFATGDSTKFANCYTADACINPPNMPRMCGTQAITTFFNAGYKQGIRNLKITTEDIIGSENSVAEIGKYEVLGDKAVSFEKGKFIVIWKNENGKWKMYRDIWNSDNPPPSVMPKEGVPKGE